MFVRMIFTQAYTIAQNNLVSKTKDQKEKKNNKKRYPKDLTSLLNQYSKTKQQITKDNNELMIHPTSNDRCPFDSILSKINLLSLGSNHIYSGKYQRSVPHVKDPNTEGGIAKIVYNWSSCPFNFGTFVWVVERSCKVLLLLLLLQVWFTCKPKYL